MLFVRCEDSKPPDILQPILNDNYMYNEHKQVSLVGFFFIGIRIILTNLQRLGIALAANADNAVLPQTPYTTMNITKRLKIMSLNKVMLIGNVGKDPEVRYLDGNNPNSGNTKVATFTLATTERYRDRNGELRENTEWHNIVAWRNSADIAEKYIHKGTQLYIEGKLRTRSWTDQTGNKKYTTEITVDNLQLLGRKPDNSGTQDGGQGYGQPALRQTQGQAYAQPQYQQGGYQPVVQQQAPQATQQSGYQQPVQQPQTPANPVEVAAADMPQDDLPF